GWMCWQPHGVREAGVAEGPRCLARPRIHVEIAGEDQSRTVDVVAAVRKNLVQLPEAKFIHASTFQVKIVAQYLSAVDRRFGNQRDSPAEPALKNRQLRHVPPRFPERGLFAEANDSE